jgi:hypothetical protein
MSVEQVGQRGHPGQDREDRTRKGMAMSGKRYSAKIQGLRQSVNESENCRQHFHETIWKTIIFAKISGFLEIENQKIYFSVKLYFQTKS